MCVGTVRGSGACQGDSGGPIVVNVNGAYEVWGATSYGIQTCDSEIAGVWAMLQGVYWWIVNVTGGGCPRN